MKDETSGVGGVGRTSRERCLAGRNSGKKQVLQRSAGRSR